MPDSSRNSSEKINKYMQKLKQILLLQMYFLLIFLSVFSETDADPHNARRGFWFSHVGWLVLTPHPDVVAKRNAVDMSDLEADPIIMWQKRLYIPLFALLVIAFPVGVPCYFWGMST